MGGLFLPRTAISRGFRQSPNPHQIDRLSPVKAVVITRYGGAEVLEVRDFPEPTPGAGEELVRVDAAGVNFADTIAASGGYPGTPTPPLVAGREFCGTRVSNGERVMGYTQWGAFAELIATRSA